MLQTFCILESSKRLFLSISIHLSVEKKVIFCVMELTFKFELFTFLVERVLVGIGRVVINSFCHILEFLFVQGFVNHLLTPIYYTIAFSYCSIH